MKLQPRDQGLQRSTCFDCSQEKEPIRGKTLMTHEGEEIESGVVLVGPGEGVDDSGEGREGWIGEEMEYEVCDL